MKSSAFMPTGKYKVPQGGPASYLDQFAGSGAPSGSGGGASSSSSGEPVLVAIDQLHVNMNKGQKATIDVLRSINSHVRVLLDKSAAGGGSSASVAGTTELEAGAAASYLSQMSGGSIAVSAGGPSGSYAPTKSSVSQKSGGTGFGSYLDQF